MEEDRAIVTDIPGTTRDILEEKIRVKDIHIVIVDSAGLRNKPEIVEEKGIQRTRNALEKSDLVLVVFDTSQPLDENDDLLMNELGDKPRCILFNKSDLEQKWEKEKIKKFLRDDKPISISAKTGAGMQDLIEAIYGFAVKGESMGESIFITRERHRNHLKQAATALEIAFESLRSGCSEELIAVDVNLALEHMGLVLGKSFEEDLLDKIFGQFCIGK